MEKYLQLISTLRKKQIRFLVIGGIAVIFYGVKRATFDMDLLIAPEKVTTERLLKVLKEKGYQKLYSISKKDPRKAKFISNINDITPGKLLVRWAFRVKDKLDVDILFAPTKDYFGFMWEHHREIIESGIKIPLPNILDLIHLKEWSGRPQDLEDVRQLRYILRMRRKFRE